MDYTRDSSHRGRGLMLMGQRSPSTPGPLPSSSSLVSPRMDHAPSTASSPYMMGGSPLLGESPHPGFPRSPMSPLGIMVKSEPPVSPSGPLSSSSSCTTQDMYPMHPKKARCDLVGQGGHGDIDKAEWPLSPGTMSVDSLSPSPPQGNGLSGGSMGGHQPSNGMSPMSSSSYDPSSPYLSRSGQWLD